MYTVYAVTTITGIITDINSSDYLPDTTGWIAIDAGDGDRYHHAQCNYMPLPLRDEQGRYRYKLVDGAVAERTPEEFAEDVSTVQSPDTTTLLQAQVQALTDRNEFLEDCIAEMASVVYGDA